jgi:FkbM family methyltransferase
LTRNAAAWRGTRAQLDVRSFAISNRPGRASLAIGAGFETNQGTAGIVDATSFGPGDRNVDVIASTLDDEFPTESLACVKIDVEGHEYAAIEGARRLLAGRRVRHVVFEDHRGYPTRTTALLEDNGYRVFAVRRGFTGPRLAKPSASSPAGEAPSYLATVDAEGAIDAMNARGWRALRGR